MKGKVLAIINPISGTKSKTQTPQAIANIYNDSNEDVYITYTKRAGHAYELALEAVNDGITKIVAVGGDGTINEVAKALTNTDASLGIIPLGSGNGLARSLGIPMETTKAIQNLIDGEIVRIDTCNINSTPFFCTTGFGFDAEVSNRFAEATTRGPLTYGISMIREYLSYVPQKCKITIDDKETFEIEAFVVAIANASQYGNDAYIAPKAKLTDGLMDLVILKPFSSFDMPKVVIQLFNKKIDKNIHQYSTTARKIFIERENPGFIHVDGEPMTINDKSLSISIIPNSLNVIVPKHSDI